MKKMKVFYLVILLLTVMFGPSQAGTVPDGVAGIPWGASRDQIIKAMSEQGYQQLKDAELKEIGTDLGFRGVFAGESCQLIFRLVANSFYFCWADRIAQSPSRQWPQESFERIVKMLTEKYGPPQKRDSQPVSDLQVAGSALYCEAAEWDLVDSRTSDKYSIRAILYRVGKTDHTLDYTVCVTYWAKSLFDRLLDRLEKEERLGPKIF